LTTTGPSSAEWATVTSDPRGALRWVDAQLDMAVPEVYGCDERDSNPAEG